MARYPIGQFLARFLLLSAFVAVLSFTLSKMATPPGTPVLDRSTADSATASSQAQPTALAQPLNVVETNSMKPNLNQQISPRDLIASELRDRQAQLIILDVRTNLEYKWKHIPGALRLNRDQILNQIPKEQPTAVICLSGHRSATMAQWLIQQGYQQVYNLKGGILQWWRAGYPTVSGSQPS